MIGRVARVGYGYPRRLMSADLVFVNGSVFTSDAARSFARAVAVGGELVNNKALREGKLDVITSKARQFVEAVRAARAATGK